MGGNDTFTMNKDEMRIKIAESCGWTDLRWIGAAGEKELYGKPAVRPGGICVPDYLADLNAMHEAEQTLWEKDWTSRHDFVDQLARIISPTHGYHQQSGLDLLDATAAQRAEAFLRTINKWEETTQ